MIEAHNLFSRAKDVLPEGSFGNFDPSIIIDKGKEAHIWDTSGNQYIDLLIGSGPMILGHSHPEVIEAVKEQLDKGTTFFATNEHGIKLAEEICEAVACAEKVRFVSTGSEADMYAMRLARAFTGKEKLIKFEGGYHGMSAEAQMSLAPQALTNFPNAVADSSGIPDSVREQVLIAPFNDIDYIRSLISEYNGQIAGIIVEPFQRIIPPIEGFLESLREECTKNDIVLIFDEVVTGFRLAYGGAQEVYGVTPDLCSLGKIIGGGFPLAAIAGKTKIMSHFDKTEVSAQQSLMQIGTLSGNPIAAVAGLKTLEILRRPGQYQKLRFIGETISKCAISSLSDLGHEHSIVGHPTLFDIVFSPKKITNYRQFLKADTIKATQFNNTLRQKGILKAPNKIYISLGLTDNDINQVCDSIRYATLSLTH